MEMKIQITCQCGYDQSVLISNVDKLCSCKKCEHQLFKLNIINGFIYILSNPAMPGLLKIGYTEKSVHERVENLNRTGVPSPFVIEAIFESNLPHDDEKKIHSHFYTSRDSKNREFFLINLELAITETTKILSNNPLFINNSVSIDLDYIRQEQLQLMDKYNVTEEDIEKLLLEISKADRNFYDDLSDHEILKKKLWEYKNW